MRPFLLPAAFVLLAFAPPAAGQTRYAVVVGVNKYDDKKLGDLSYAEADADALAKVLRAAGFTVTPLLGKDAARAAIQDAVDGILRKATKDDTLLFAFSGHGQQFKPLGENDDVPFLCPPECDALKADTLVRLNDLLTKAGDAKVGKGLFLIDACRNDPAGARGGVNGNAVSLKAQTAVLFAAANGQKAREHKDAGGPGVGRGLFMSEVIEAIGGKARNDDGEVTWDGLVARVKSGVKKKSRALFPNIEDNQHQTPQQAGSLVGEAVLAAHLWPGEEEFDRAESLKWGVPGKVKIDAVEADKWYRKAADKGHPLAAVVLAGQKPAEAKTLSKAALDEILKAANGGDVRARYFLGDIHHMGIGVKKDNEKALEWYRKAAQQSSGLAQNGIGHLYVCADGLKTDYKEALRWFQLAADQKLATAQYDIGIMYSRGTGDLPQGKWTRS